MKDVAVTPVICGNINGIRTIANILHPFDICELGGLSGETFNRLVGRLFNFWIIIPRMSIYGGESWLERIAYKIFTVLKGYDGKGCKEVNI